MRETTLSGTEPALAVERKSRTLTTREFKLFQELVYRQAGIFLSDAKRSLLVGRLSRRLRELGIDSFGEYYRYVTKEDAAEGVRMLDCICTNETQFFREGRQFDFVEERVPELRAKTAARGRRIRVWSAACSTGEEPYSLAMMLLTHFPPDSGWQVEILASDLSTRALARAREGVWPVEKAREIPKPFLKRFMLRGTRSQDGKMKAGPEIRSAVRFERINLNDEGYAVKGPFDLVFCRNVLIYFDAQSKLRVIRNLLRHMAGGGYLFLGHSESLLGIDQAVRRVGPTVYAVSPQ
jgi:chemotaxis protein methyltransferase CheR